MQNWIDDEGPGGRPHLEGEMEHLSWFDFIGWWALFCAACYGLVIGPLWLIDRLTWRLWGWR